ncbi:unnamed protein product [Enterobius vermicularis]|uniref:WIYLD domain-containing protein n=1 Tax=Enterobius vermicularis TaxID=51028 RepID=A0A0N4V1L7_ENTVE|nr:unnamed protein product [Enterobius vermicularis]
MSPRKRSVAFVFWSPGTLQPNLKLKQLLDALKHLNFEEKDEYGSELWPLIEKITVKELNEQEIKQNNSTVKTHPVKSVPLSRQKAPPMAKPQIPKLSIEPMTEAEMQEASETFSERYRTAKPSVTVRPLYYNIRSKYRGIHHR